jgi:WD40 repeat protein
VGRSLGGEVVLLDARSGQEQRRIRLPGKFIFAVAFAPDGRHLLAGNDEGVVAIFRLAPPPSAEVKPIVPPLARSPFDQLKREDIPAAELAAAALDGDAANAPRELVAVLGDSRLKHWTEPHLVAFSADGSRIVSLANDDRGRIWDAQTGQQISSFLAYRSFWAVADGGSRVAYGYRDKSATILDSTTGKVIATSSPHGASIIRAAFTTRGQRLITVAEDGSVKVCEGSTGKELLAFQGPAGNVEAVACTPDGARIATSARANADQPSVIQVWDPATGKEIAKQSGEAVIRLAFTPDGRYLFGSQSYKPTLMWDLQAPGAPREWPGKPSSAPTFSPDGQRFLLSSSVFDMATGKVIATLDLGATTHPTCGAFSPDGQRVVVGTSDQYLSIFDATTGKRILGPG